jgi:hypothetical protein
MNTYRACYLEFTALVKPLNMVGVWVWLRGKRQLLHHLRACQVVAAATVNNDPNGAFLHNAFGMEQGVALVLLWLCNLRAEYALHKTLILVSVASTCSSWVPAMSVASIAYMVSSESLAEEYSPLSRIISVRLLGQSHIT